MAVDASDAEGIGRPGRENDGATVDERRHPHARAYTRFNRRARGGRLDAARVEFALVDASMADAVLESGIDVDPEARTGSDHAPLWVTLDEARLAC